MPCWPRPSAAPAPTVFVRDRLAPILILAAAVAAYANVFSGAFQFDDFAVIVGNHDVHSLDAWWTSMPGIRPLLKLSYAADWTLWPSAAGFHVFNLACHGVNGLLAYFLLLRLAPRQTGAALATSLLFVLHPAQTEAVTYIAGRSVALMALFYLAAILVFVADRGRRGDWLAAALLAGALAVRETAWTLPFALLLVARSTGPTDWRRLPARLAPQLAVLAAFTAVVLWLPGYRRLLAVSFASRGITDNLLTQIAGVGYLVTHPLLGLDLNIDPDLAVATAWTPELALALLGFLAIPALAWRCRVFFPELLPGLLWFALHLLPTNSFIPRLDVANDRHLYLAMLGPAFALAMGFARLGRPRLAWAVAVLLILVLGVRTFERNADYRSEVALWTATAARSPNKARVWNNLGFALATEGRPEEARVAYRRALALAPDDLKARLNIEALPSSSAAGR